MGDIEERAEQVAVLYQYRDAVLVQSRANEPTELRLAAEDLFREVINAAIHLEQPVITANPYVIGRIAQRLADRAGQVYDLTTNELQKIGGE